MYNHYNQPLFMEQIFMEHKYYKYSITVYNGEVFLPH